MEALLRPSRLDAVARTALMGTAPEVEFDRLVRLARRALGADAAVLNLLDGAEQFCKSAHDPQERLTAGATLKIGDTLCQHVVGTGRPVRSGDLPDGGPGGWCPLDPTPIRVYVGVPVRAGDEVIGALCALSRTPREWSEEDVQTMEDVAAAVSTEIDLRGDIRARNETEQKLRESESRFRAVFEACGLGIAIVDARGRVEKSNPALLRMLHYEVGELEHHPVDAVVHPDDLRIDREHLEELCRGSRDRYQVEKRFIRRDGSTIWGRLTVTTIDQPADESPRVLEIIEDVTASKEMEEELRQLSLTDPLTGLHNRRGFLHLAEQQWKLARKKQQRLTLVYADLDGFKRINDAYGHSMGDVALVEVASLLRRRYRDTDVVARMGGDEFVVLAVEAECDDETLTHRLESSIEAFNRESRLPFPLGLSLGIIRFEPTDRRSLGELLEIADREMYQSKRRQGD
jgi:diguanylate cyclase (GGDEF)-like protein/PAS domain S-box-containing protein